MENAVLRSLLWQTGRALKEYADSPHTPADDGRLTLTVPASLREKAAEVLARATAMLKEGAQEQEAIKECRQISRKNDWSYVPGEFRTRFISPFEEHRDRIGQRFTVVRRLSAAERSREGSQEECLDMYLIRFGDGAEITARGEEVCLPVDRDTPTGLVS